MPQPNVTSVVFLIPKNQILPSDLLEALEGVLKISFNAPRKTIFNNHSKNYSKQKVLEVLEDLQITPNKRPHEIDTATYHRLLKIL